MQGKLEKPFLEEQREFLGLTDLSLSRPEIGHDPVKAYIDGAWDKLKYLSVPELCDLLHVVARYGLFLREHLGRWKGKLDSAERNYELLVLTEASNYNRAGSASERRALAISKSPSLQGKRKELEEYRELVINIDPIIWGVDKLIDALQCIVKNKGNYGQL